MLVSERRKVKQQLKQVTHPEVKQQLNIKQLAFKILANSMYGCLGFVNSRFYASTIAAVITAMVYTNSKEEFCREDAF